MLYKLLICNCSAHRLNMSEDIYSIATIAVLNSTTLDGAMAF